MMVIMRAMIVSEGDGRMGEDDGEGEDEGGGAHALRNPAGAVGLPRTDLGCVCTR